MEHPDFFILTGGPGSGKTSVLTALAKKGFLTVPEVARKIIKEEEAISGNALHTGDRDAFLERMFVASILDYKKMKKEKTAVFFDRGLPDLVGYAKAFCHKEYEKVNDGVKTYRYHPIVFIFPPWQEIYTNDKERQQDFEECLYTYHALKEAYQRCEYTPFLSVKARVEFILKTLMEYKNCI